MSFWIFLWKFVFIGGLSVFAVMAVWVSIAGWADVKKLLNKKD